MPKRKGKVTQASSSGRSCAGYRNQSYPPSWDSTAMLIDKRMGTAIWMKILIRSVMTQTEFPADLLFVLILDVSNLNNRCGVPCFRRGVKAKLPIEPRAVPSNPSCRRTRRRGQSLSRAC